MAVTAHQKDARVVSVFQPGEPGSHGRALIPLCVRSPRRVSWRSAPCSAFSACPILLRWQTEAFGLRVDRPAPGAAGAHQHHPPAGSADRNQPRNRIPPADRRLSCLTEFRRKKGDSGRAGPAGRPSSRTSAARWTARWNPARKCPRRSTQRLATFDALMKRFGVRRTVNERDARHQLAPFQRSRLRSGRRSVLEPWRRMINLLVSSVNQSVPQLERLSQKSHWDAQKVVDHGFRLGTRPDRGAAGRRGAGRPATDFCGKT